MDVNDIVLRQQTDQLQYNPQKKVACRDLPFCRSQCFLQKKTIVAFQLGVLRNEFATRIFHEDYMENVDETHFVINCDNGKNIGVLRSRRVVCQCGIERRENHHDSENYM